MSTMPPDTDVDPDAAVDALPDAGAPTEPLTTVVAPAADDPTYVPPPYLPPPGDAAFAPEPEPERERHVPVGRITFSAILIVVGVLGLLDVSGADISAEGVLAAALVTTGLGLVVGAWFGRPRGLVPLGVILTLALGATAALGVPLRGGVGERIFEPGAGDVLPEVYRLGIGHLVIDLSELDLAGESVALETTLGIGELVVVVPADVDVEVAAEAAAGELDLFGQTDDGVSVSDRVVSEAPGDADGVLLLDARIGLGRVEVRRASDLYLGEQ